MLSGIKPTTDDRIVNILVDRPAQTAAELFERVHIHTERKPTIQGWYKALRRLVKQEILIKDGKTYSLNARWILNVIRWAEQAEKSHLGKFFIPAVRLPTSKQRIVFHFNSLLAMDTFWGHLLIYIASRAKKPTLYAYNHHFWFYLAHEQAEKEYNRGMDAYGVKTRMIIGSDSFLDRWSAKFFGNSFSYWLHPVSMYVDERAAYNYLDGYFIEVKIPLSAAQEIDVLFATAKNLDQVSPLALIKLFHNKNRCSITVSQSKTKGENLKRKVERFLSKSKK